jgi:hypothetical protein
MRIAAPHDSKSGAICCCSWPRAEGLLDRPAGPACWRCCSAVQPAQRHKDPHLVAPGSFDDIEPHHSSSGRIMAVTCSAVPSQARLSCQRQGPSRCTHPRTCRFRQACDTHKACNNGTGHQTDHRTARRNNSYEYPTVVLLTHHQPQLQPQHICRADCKIVRAQDMHGDPNAAADHTSADGRRQQNTTLPWPST